MKKKFIVNRILAVCLALLLAISSIPAGVVHAEEIPSDDQEMTDSIDASVENEIEEIIDTEEIGSDYEEENVSEIPEEPYSETEDEFDRWEDSESEENYEEDSENEDFFFIPNEKIINNELDLIDFSPEEEDYSGYSFYISEYAFENDVRNFYSDEDTKYDSRTYSLITPVRNQNPYGSCWAHAALAGVESNVLKKGLYDDPSTLDLSEQHLAYFTYNSQTDPLGLTEGDSLKPNYEKETNVNYRNFLAYGGDAGMAGAFLMNWEGPVDETIAPYQNSNTTITDLDSALAYTHTAYHVQGMYLASMKDINAVKKLIVDYGAVASAYGQYGEENKSLIYFKDNKNYFYSENGKSTNHAITIVGWDDNYSASNFSGLGGKTPSKDGAWIVKNSWGKDRFDAGYIYISYYEGSMYQNATAYAYDVEPADNYDNNYHYDGIPWNYSTGELADKQEFANIFTAQASETEIVEAVNIYFKNTNTKYTINVYKGTAAPESNSIKNSNMGELVYTVSGTSTYAGYYTFVLPAENQFEVGKGDNFAVSVVLDSGAQMAYVKEYVDNGRSYLYYNQSANASYKRSYNGTTWNRHNNVDYLIKAYTSNMVTNFENVTAKANGYDFYQVEWDRVPGCTSYEIYARTNEEAEGAEQLVMTVPAEAGKQTYSCIIEGMHGTTYYIYIIAKRKKMEIKSNEAMAVIPPKKAIMVVNEPVVTLKSGQKLQDGILTEALYAQKENATEEYTLEDGTIIWEEPEKIYTIAGDTEEARYLFKPSFDGLLSISGTAKVVVEKVKPEITIGHVSLEESEDKIHIVVPVEVVNPYNSEMNYSSLKWEITLLDETESVVWGPLNGESENAKEFTLEVSFGALNSKKPYMISIKIASPEYEESEIKQELYLKEDLTIAGAGILNANRVNTEGMFLAYENDKTVNLEAIAVNKRGWKISLEGTPVVTWTISDSNLAEVQADSQCGAVLTIKNPGTFHVTVKINYEQEEYSKTIKIMAMDPSVQLSTEKLAINFQNSIPESGTFLAEANHGLSIVRGEIKEIRKGKEFYDTDSLEISFSGKEAVLRIADGFSLSKGIYKVKAGFVTQAFIDNYKEASVLIDTENTYEFTKMITLNVTDVRPTVKVGKPSINLFYTDGDTQDAMVTSTNGKITEIKAVNDYYGFDQYFSFAKDPVTEEWKVILNREPGMPWNDYKQSSMSGKIQVWVEGYKDPVTKKITISTPTKEPSLKQKSVPSIQLYDCQDTEKIFIPLEIYDNTRKCDLTDYEYSPDYNYFIQQGEKIRMAGDKETGIYLAINKSCTYKNGEILTLLVPIKKDNYLRPTKKITVKAKVYTVPPKVVMSKTTAQFNRNEEFIVSSNECKETVRLSAWANHGNVEIDSISSWKVEIYNSSTKNYEMLPASLDFYNEEIGIRVVNGFEMEYNPTSQEIIIRPENIRNLSVGSFKLRFYPMNNFPQVYQDITINIVDKPVTANVKVKGALNLLDRENSYVKLAPSVKNSQAAVINVRVDQTTNYKYYFEVDYDGMRLKAKDIKTLAAGGYYNIPLELELENGMIVKTTAKVTVKLVTPKLNCPSVITLSKYYGIENRELDFKEYIPEGYKVDKIEVVSILSPAIKATPDQDKLDIGIEDYTCKCGNYSVTIKIYYHGDDKEVKPVTKKITVKVTN